MSGAKDREPYYTNPDSVITSSAQKLLDSSPNSQKTVIIECEWLYRAIVDQGISRKENIGRMEFASAGSMSGIIERLARDDSSKYETVMLNNTIRVSASREVILSLDKRYDVRRIDTPRIIRQE